MSIHSFPARASALAALLVFGLAGRAGAVVVQAPCPAGADPCVVAAALTLPADAVLDVGLRTLRVDGRVDTTGNATVMAGRIEIAASSGGIRVGGDSALVEVVSRGRCARDGAPCLEDADCGQDEAASCGSGAAVIEVRAPVTGSGAFPGLLRLRSAGTIAVEAPVSMAGTRSDSDGGVAQLRSFRGDLLVHAPVTAASGGLASGGSVRLAAGGDVEVTAPLTATGGDGGGGWIDVESGRDAVITADLAVGATSGSGSGGETWIAAGRDLRLAGGTATRGVEVGGDGHQSSDGSGGDGAALALEAGRDLVVSRYVRLSSAGAAPDGFGDEVMLEAGRDVVFEGRVAAPGRGSWSAGGLCEILAGGRLLVAPTAAFDLAGPSLGGDLLAVSGGEAQWSGDVDVRAAPGGSAGRIAVEAGGDLLAGGAWRTAGGEVALAAGSLDASGCHVRVTGSLDNDAVGGTNRLAARASLVVEESAEVRARGQSGSNRFVLDAASPPPLVAGVVHPAPVVEEDAGLGPCPACAGAEGDGTCIDGRFCAAPPACDEGLCEELPAVEAGGSVHVRLRAVPGRVPRAIVKAVLAGAAAEASPGGLSLRVVVGERAGGNDAAFLVDAMLAAGALRPQGRAWRYLGEPGRGFVDALVRRDEARGALKLRLRIEEPGLALVPQAIAARATVLVGGPDQDGTAAGACASSHDLTCRSRGDAVACATPP